MSSLALQSADSGPTIAGQDVDVLVVEDDRATAHGIRLLLEADGYSVATRGNGQDALDYLGAGARPGLILLDLTMPVLDGWKFRVRQRRTPGLADIPVVLVAGTDRLEEKARALDAAGWLEKPIEPARLLALVAKQMTARHGALC